MSIFNRRGFAYNIDKCFLQQILLTFVTIGDNTSLRIYIVYLKSILSHEAHI